MPEGKGKSQGFWQKAIRWDMQDFALLRKSYLMRVRMMLAVLLPDRGHRSC